ncbi:dihydrofolate reductase isoform X1 [Phalacrocorax aristotelis]|uniref:dihydrofolate reductase isoform X1 n=1 Tax=Phalacrocorax aristotelis TaxID=126867 RepID=UPI003F4C4E1D
MLCCAVLCSALLCSFQPPASAQRCPPPLPHAAPPLTPLRPLTLPRHAPHHPAPLSCCALPRSEVRRGGDVVVDVMVRSLNSIVAVCQNMGIGKDGSLPWPPLRNEYKYFQRMTSTSHIEGKQNALIMGKKTWFSIPEKNRPLKDRINIVLSRELKETPKGAHYLSKSLDDALALLDSPELKSKVDMVWIVGGTSVYKAAMEKPINHRLFVTRILQEFESDTFFPEIDYKDYKLITEYPGVPADIQEENGIQYKFEVYEKAVLAQ